ncbi:Rab-like protein 3 [Sarcoptes scabiei]|uniref:Rab-like protein 3 n=1 Tax=Sarcoptes scabiei TaxID=52283 RepID=A0A834R609_SARSC|nr:Rab-like protein 3 [Sarcoptes scabiei]
MASVVNEKIKILVLGDSGVGKSSLVHLICHSKAISSTQWTIGCLIDVKLHYYKEGTIQQKACYIEFWDVGGSRSHSIARKIFYNSFHGIILVQDSTNSKSETNLKNWLGQALCGTNEKDRYYKNALSQALFPVSNDDNLEYDVESFIGLDIPVLIVATKQDLIGDSKELRSELVDLLHCEFMAINCCNSKSFAPGSTNAVKLSRFLDQVCDKRFHFAHQSTSGDQRSLHQRQFAPSNLKIN